MAKAKKVGILTAGGDSPALNATIRGFGKTAMGQYGIELIGFRDGVTGLVENRFTELDGRALSGILTVGGTILGTSRDKVHKFPTADGPVDMVPTVVENYEKDGLDALIMLGGGGTAKNAMRLVDAGLNVIHLPKTIDNDIAMTDTTFGFATALEIATEAIDRLHSTAHSHHRIILTEIMGHKAGWLTLGAGIAGGADIILIPEIPYTVDSVVSTIKQRTERGLNFSVVAVAEGARDVEDTADYEAGPPAVQERQDARIEGRGPHPPEQRGTFPARAHLQAGQPTGGGHRPGGPGDDSGLRAARRHPLGGRPAAGHPAGRRRGRPGGGR